MAGNKIAIFALDGGTVSGCARGVFPKEPRSVWEGLEAGVWESYEVEGAPAQQAWEIIWEFSDWVGGPGYTKLPGAILVFEDFVMRLGRGASSKRSLLDPVRVCYACEALTWQRSGIRWAFPVYQQPSMAMNFATNERLRAHGMWVVGSEHRRDAVRHMAAKYASIIGKGEKK